MTSKVTSTPLSEVKVPDDGLRLCGAPSMASSAPPESPEAALLSPEQGFFLKENLKFKVLNARLSLLARQNDAARADLQAAQVALKKYFDTSAKKTQLALQLLDKAQALSKGSPIPRLDASLAALATISAGK